MYAIRDFARGLTLYLAVSLPFSASAADAEAKFTVLSFGAKSCGVVVSDFEKNEWQKLLNSGWVGGFLTAINAVIDQGGDIAKGTDPAGRDLWIYNYCKANPLHTLYNATDALTIELLSRTR
tara:strand:+ start:663 stop:1028 length:366 start_codon:yes stop_codon:yes gene_type:complete